MIFSRAKNKEYGFLILEFVVLVLGFFISLQVNEWQNDREDRELESQYLSRLENDFEKSIVALNESIDRIGRSVERLESGLTVLAKRERSEGDYPALFFALQSSSLRGSFPVYFGTFEELKDTGSMRLIESTQLRESLGNVWQKHVAISKISEVRNMLRGNTFPVMTSYVKPLEGNAITFDAEKVEEDPRELYVALSIIRTNLENDLTDSEAMLTLIEEALGVLRQDTAYAPSI